MNQLAQKIRQSRRLIPLNAARFTPSAKNPFLAFAYNVAAIPLAAAGILHPMLAAAVMSLSSVSVIVNALRLRRLALRENSARVFYGENVFLCDERSR